MQGSRRYHSSRTRQRRFFERRGSAFIRRRMKLRITGRRVRRLAKISFSYYTKQLAVIYIASCYYYLKKPESSPTPLHFSQKLPTDATLKYCINLGCPAPFLKGVGGVTGAEPLLKISQGSLPGQRPGHREQSPQQVFPRFADLMRKTTAAMTAAAIRTISMISTAFIHTPPRSIPMICTINAATHAIAHCHTTTNAAYLMPSSLFMAATAATHGV